MLQERGEVEGKREMVGGLMQQHFSRDEQDENVLCTPLSDSPSSARVLSDVDKLSGIRRDLSDSERLSVVGGGGGGASLLLPRHHSFVVGPCGVTHDFSALLSWPPPIPGQ